MVDRLYSSSNITTEEAPFKDYFEQLVFEFGEQYEIWSRKEDFGRRIAASVVNRRSLVAVIIYFKYKSISISHPLNEEVIDLIRQHLISDATEDLQINVLSSLQDA
ncbi:hypothetical protein H6F78_01600 [Coleofasciculus sp. FACHB-64]|uniref:hypothetical protein n=1 Tax=Cyanophyceae TaxID=3028117 RepID=UPI00168440E6|nr:MULTISPECIES: hypothetical protein [unclassified Coleofasciculus]MBD1839799.1 hypothetical protein [Coleofasciculus sp. FACHB-501]MBD2044335.1 hypothetical protein [Coleofasciculus sp. FACHB-64]